MAADMSSTLPSQPEASTSTTSTSHSSSSSEQLIPNITLEVEQYFRNPLFDGSHDFIHIRRVLGLAKKILKSESQNNPHQKLESDLVTLGALLHDVGDHKYQPSGVSELVTAKSLLLKHGATLALAEKVQTIVTNVSYTNETLNPSHVANLISQIPELAIVQDADRLDAIGAIGVGRCFTYGGARGRNMDDTFAHFDEKLVKLEGMMKTETGRGMARERTERVGMFMGWWTGECGVLEEV